MIGLKCNDNKLNWTWYSFNLTLSEEKHKKGFIKKHLDLKKLDQK